MAKQEFTKISGEITSIIADETLGCAETPENVQQLLDSLRDQFSRKIQLHPLREMVSDHQKVLIFPGTPRQRANYVARDYLPRVVTCHRLHQPRRLPASRFRLLAIWTAMTVPKYALPHSWPGCDVT